jgi:hypothetical protein
MRDWAAHQVRFTLFTTEPLRPAEPSSYWEALVGSPPEVDEYIRTQNLRRQAGPYDSGVLELALQAGRIDWFLSPGPAGPGEFPTLGAPKSTIESLLKQITKWLSNSSLEYNRVALGPVLLLAVADLIGGYRVILELVRSIKIDVDNEDISDLFFQINRPIKSKKLEGLIFNRLMKWSVLSTRLFQISSVEESPLTFPGRFFCRLELDVNTKPKPDAVFKQADIQPILEEALVLVEEIAARGEMA